MRVAEFATWWDLHRVKGVSSQPIELLAPNGLVKLDRMTLHPAGFEDVTIVVHMPRNERDMRR